MSAIRNNMKRMVLCLLTLLVLTSSVSAAGVGIKYTFEAAEVEQKRTTCLDYSVYNPFEEDVTATILASGDFADYQVKKEEIFVPGGTYNTESKKLPVCFKVPKLTEDCDNPSMLTGSVAATLVRDNKLSGSGASTQMAVSAPLDLTVLCATPIGFAFFDEIEPNIFLGAGIGGLIALIIFIIWFLIKRKKKKPVAETSSKDEYMSKYSDMMVIHKKISANIASPEEVEQYKTLRSELEALRSKL